MSEFQALFQAQGRHPEKGQTSNRAHQQITILLQLTRAAMGTILNIAREVSILHRETNSEGCDEPNNEESLIRKHLERG
jgi:hypothetical protein